MAASAKMSFNYYQNGKYGTLPQNSTMESEVTQDMHLKMSKKIAQLTKVIYALNTKNDENEAAVQNLKDQHEEEIQQLLSESKNKMAVYQNEISDNLNFIRKIETLEKHIAENETQRLEAMSKFDKYKKEAEHTENSLKTENSQKMLSLSQEVLQAKRKFEEQMQKFDEWRNTVDMEKEKALVDLKKAHEQELDLLQKFQHSQDNDWLNQCATVEDTYKDELESLKNKCQMLSDEKLKLTEDYELKLSKAQAFFEKELEALNQSKESDSNVAIRLKEEQEKLRKSFAAREAELQKQIDSLVEKLSLSEESTEQYKSELEQMQCNLENKDTTFSSLSKQLENAKQEACAATTRLKEVELELFAFKERCKEQATDLLKKSNVIGQLEAAKLQNESTIHELLAENEKLKDRMSWLESERKDLENQKLSLSDQQQAQLRSLEKALDDMSLEKQKLRDDLERQLKSLRECYGESEQEQTARHAAALDEARKKYEIEFEMEKKRSDELLSSTKQDLQKKYEEDTDKLTMEKEALKSEFDRVKVELLTKLTSAEDEVHRLDNMIKESEQGLGSATSHINNLKDASIRLRSELDNTRSELQTAKLNSSSLQGEHNKLRSFHEAKMKEAQNELKSRLDQLSSDLESKWSDTLRNECAKLREELTRQKEDEQRAALKELARLKDEEIGAAKATWQSKINDLLLQISHLKESIDNNQSSSSKEMEEFRKSTEAEQRRLEQELLSAADEYAKKIQTMKEAQTEKLKKIKEQYEQEISEIEKELKTKHMGDTQSQLAAHKFAIEILKHEEESKRMSDLKALETEHQDSQDDLRNELYERHSSELNQLNRAHEAQLNAARMELGRAVEIAKQKDFDHSMRVEELQGEITHRERHITNLASDMHKLQNSIDNLAKDLEMKGKEIQKIRIEADIQIRKREEQLGRGHEMELDNLRADHLRESQDLVSQFKQAQEILKDKISSLQILLQEAEENYLNRESRPEDLELIEQLRDSVSQREIQVKQLIDEKRFYQLELVNRETNFNKVFNNSPNVGVLNPLQKGRNKRGDKNPSKHISAPNLNAFGSQRLDPLPGSPMHDEKLNPSRPLPAPFFTKKFVK